MQIARVTVHGYIKSLNKGEARLHLRLFLGKVERQDTYVLTGGVQVVLSKCIRRTDQDWSKNLPICKSFNATKTRAEALPAAQTDIPREHVMLKFKGEDAEAVMAKALEGRSESGKEEALSPEPMPIPALEIPVEAMKRDGNKGNQVEKKHRVRNRRFFADGKTHEKVNAVPSTSLPAGHPNPATPIIFH